MPGGDRTGPLGAGPRTGRGLGYCSGSSHPGWVYGRGYGRGMGFGRGRRCGRGFWGRGRWCFYGAYVPTPYNVPYDEETEKRTLEAEANYLRNTLKEIEERLNQLAQK
ncbi:hypothetical protein JCM13304A_01150 [Desulfothermus okinawensis JCM 13304]